MGLADVLPHAQGSPATPGILPVQACRPPLPGETFQSPAHAARVHRDSPMPKPNYGFEKRQRELEKKRKKEEKAARKAAPPPASEPGAEQPPEAEQPAPPSPA